MIHSIKINLDKFFFEVQDQEYAIIKLNDELSNYYKGSDIDIFCVNKNEFAKRILKVGNSYLDHGFSIEVTNTDDNAKTYIDFYFNNELDFRFDLYQSLPQYTRIRLKDFYLFSLIDRRRFIIREFDNVKYPLYIPAEIDDLILRYVEYIEWYEQREDKVKHLDYILKSISSEPDRIRFIDRLHLYTELPNSSSKSNVKKFHISKKIYRSFIFSTQGIRSTPLHRIPGKILGRLRRLVQR